jgi:hypothetical protein
MLDSARWLIAHQGGWDEILMFAVPVVLAVVAVRWVERRSKRAPNDTADSHPDPQD